MSGYSTTFFFRLLHVGVVVARLFRRFVFEQLRRLETWLLLSRYWSYRAAALRRPASEIGKP